MRAAQRELEQIIVCELGVVLPVDTTRDYLELASIAQLVERALGQTKGLGLPMPPAADEDAAIEPPMSTS